MKLGIQKWAFEDKIKKNMKLNVIELVDIIIIVSFKHCPSLTNKHTFTHTHTQADTIT